MNGNRIYKIDKNGKKRRVFFVPGLRIHFKGKNSIVELTEPLPKLTNCRVRMGNNSLLKIGASKFYIKNMKACINADGGKLIIGDNFSARNTFEIHVGGETCTIGDTCMFGRNILVRCVDGHSIYSEDNQVNSPSSIEIGNHVWLAEGVCVLKGVKIANNCVVGLRSIVTKSIEEPNSLAAGSPAKIVKKISTWDRQPPYKLM